MKKESVAIMGAAGRDFHNFNVYFRENPQYVVVAFVATGQIPFTEGKTYPASLAGRHYAGGIPIVPEAHLSDLILQRKVDLVVFAYSDVSHEEVMHKASAIVASGADFLLLGPTSTMLESKKPVISVCATRTGCGKSQTTRKILQILKSRGLRAVSVRHPMPYGELEKQKVQRFERIEDLNAHNCTIEEMEEYEPTLRMGAVVYAGVDYKSVLESAEKEADLIVWDGGNNDFPFFKPDLEVVLLDAHRAGHEMHYYPGEVNLRRANVFVINKLDTSNRADVEKLRKDIFEINPDAVVVDAASPVFVQDLAQIRGKRVLIIGDGPTLTHGEMQYDAGGVAARKYGAREIVDPRPFLKGSLLDTFDKYPNIGAVLPAMGYSPEQIGDLKATIDAVDCDLIVIGTPIDLSRIIELNKPFVRVKYELQEIGKPDLREVLDTFLQQHSWRF